MIRRSHWLVYVVCLGVLMGCGVSSPLPGDPSVDPTQRPGDEPKPSESPTPPPPETPAIPELIQGLFFFVRARGHDSVGPYDAMSGSGVFTPVSVPLFGLLDPVLSYHPEIPLDSCQPSPTGAIAVGSNQAFLDAGFVSLVGPAGPLNFFPLAGVHVALSGPSSLFIPNETYAFEGSGGSQIPAFSEPVYSPGDIEVTSPDLMSADPYPVDRSQDIELTWTSVPDGRDVFVFLSQGYSESPVKHFYACRFADDGSATIPAATLSAFDATQPPATSAEGTIEDTLEIVKYRWGTIQPAPLPEPVLTVFESKWWVHVEFY